MHSSLRTLDTLNFDNSYARLPAHFYQRIGPTPLEETHLISINPEVAELVDLDPSQLNSEDLVRYFGGHESLPGTESIAMKYTGHQFGIYNPDLGDGRGLLLGEILNEKGERWDLHLKGAGRTAYSRHGDGRAVLRSSIREYLAGEAMHGLNIPTTRSLCLVGSKEQVFREEVESCAALVRVSRCHIRFGHFEYFFHQGQQHDLQLLADYCIDRYFPAARNSSNPYQSMFEEIVLRSAQLVALWQTYGFVHGVLNTDNMSILGETFDYGPYTFKDYYRPSHVSNHTDQQGRYAFYKQPDIVLWNLSSLAQALTPLVDSKILNIQLGRFSEQFNRFYLNRMRARLGLQRERDEDQQLVDDLCILMAKQRVDSTRFFRALTELDTTSEAARKLHHHFPDSSEFKKWLQRYTVRADIEVASIPIRRMQMRSVNPKYILRNYMVEEVIRAADKGDFKPINDLLDLLRHPFAEHPKQQRYAEAAPEWANQISLSCSS